jgi:hypothetical protein
MALHGEFCLQFDEGDIARAIYDPEDEVADGFDALRAAVAALRRRLWRSGVTSAGAPPHGARCPHAEALRRLPTRHSAFDSGNNTFTQVERESLRHHDWPPSASLNVESDESRFGNPASIQYERKPL